MLRERLYYLIAIPAWMAGLVLLQWGLGTLSSCAPAAAALIVPLYPLIAIGSLGSIFLLPVVLRHIETVEE